MGKLENTIASFLTICAVAFVVGAILAAVCFLPIVMIALGRFWMAMLVLGVALMLLSLVVAIGGFLLFASGYGFARAKSRAGPPRRFAAKIHAMWRSDAGRVVDPYETELDRPAYHVVLVGEDGKRMEVETAEAVWGGCIEGAWGWAEVRGDWMGCFERDAELQRRHAR